MKNKILLLILMVLSVITLTACNKDEKTEDALKFKEEYESLNDTTNSSGKKHRNVSIDEINPFVYSTPEEIVEKIENGETFYVYFGSKSCPWCRSVIEKTIEVANKKDIKTIYYIDIWDEKGNEILRDKYKLENDVPVIVSEGTESYHKLLAYFDNVLTSYTLNDSNGNKVEVGEKRIFAPNFIYIENGAALKITDATSSSQKDSREELTSEMLKDEEDLLNEFFKN